MSRVISCKWEDLGSLGLLHLGRNGSSILEMCVVTLDRITEDLPKPYNRLAPLHVSMATHGLPVWHHQLDVCIFTCVVEVGGSLQLISIPILPLYQ